MAFEPQSSPEKVGPYTILDRLGAGGMGTVYLGRHAETNVIAAVKVLPGSLARETGFVERFNREIAAMRTLNNPHIVKLYENGVDEQGTYYYAMEHVPGETVMSLLRRERRVDWERTVHLTIQICQALKAAHDAGIIHRDLKPSNLLLTPEGDIKLTDFGVAQVFSADRLTITGGIIGTAEFMSPEQAQGKRANRQSDLYSLGAVMYCLVTGRPPFSGNSTVDVIQKHKFGLFDPPRLIVPEIPDWLEKIICQLLEKDPEKRFPDAHVLMRKLDSMSLRSITLSDVTFATDGTRDVHADTVLSEPLEATQNPGGPGPATLMKDLMRAELIREANMLSALLNNTWILLALLALLIGGATWYAMRPTQDSALQDDSLAPSIQKLSVALKSQRGFSSDNDGDRLLLRAQQLQREGDTQGAKRLLASFVAVLSSLPKSEKDARRATQLDLAQRFLKKLEEQPSAQDRFPLLQAGLKQAAALEKDGRKAEAAALREGLEQLYGSEPDARLMLKAGKNN